MLSILFRGFPRGLSYADFLQGGELFRISDAFERLGSFLIRHEQSPTVLDISSSRDLYFPTMVGGVNRRNEADSATTEGDKMKKTIGSLIILGLVSILGPLGGQNSSPWLSGPLEDALAKAKSQGKMILVDFFSPG